MTSSIDLPIGRCGECGADGFYLDRILLEHFALHVCVTCKQHQTLRDGAFELLSKSRARVEYALPDSSFWGLSYLSKPNLRHEAFAPVQLYLRRTLIQEAYRLYGDEEGLQQEKRKRKKRAFRVAASRTKHVLKRQHRMGSKKGDEEAKETKNKVDYVSMMDKDHRHDFGIEMFDAERKTWIKKCECGMHVQFEKW
ncbi:unnamed protein product [Peronospora destructor]|uniref:XPA C-terminal domain-containing protein n=1 Tax=Peronospora destructor TaxID=86335 RepID=A0AAV0TPT2_9STRA|nr:unnamed protein product [Peronospora destructor]